MPEGITVKCCRRQYNKRIKPVIYNYVTLYKTLHMKKFIVVCLTLMGLSSCSVFQKKQNIETTDEMQVKRESVLPTDRENIVQPVSAVYTSLDLSKGIVKGDWAIETVNGEKVVGEKAPFLKFVPSENRVYGNNGCNVINAEYKYNPEDSTLSFAYLSSTMRLCHKEGITDMAINLALDAVRYYSWDLNGDDYYMTLYDSERKPVMELMHQNFQFLNGTWLVKEISGEAVNVPNMKLVIDVDEGKLHGNTGCNVINGSLEINMDSANSISFQAISKTLMLCPGENYETQLLVALEEAVKAKPLKGGRVELLDSQEKPVLLLERTSDK